MLWHLGDIPSQVEKHPVIAVSPDGLWVHLLASFLGLVRQVPCLAGAFCKGQDMICWLVAVPAKTCPDAAVGCPQVLVKSLTFLFRLDQVGAL